MNLFAHIALIGWIPVILVLFGTLPARRAVVVAMIGAWLFLPIAGYHFDGWPSYTKMSATTVGILLAVCLFDAGRIMQFRPSLLDLPMLAWCLVPMASSLTNGLGVNDGLSSILRHVITWGLPYLIGRLYFGNLAGLRELAVGIFIGGLIYVPLCLFEVRMSPQLHTWVYGFHQHSFLQAIRFGGYRPTVFMAHGLEVGLWMCVTSMVGVWLWMSGVVTKVRNIPMSVLVPALIITAVLCKSLGALALLVVGVGALIASRMLNTRLILAAVILASPTYMLVRSTGTWTAEPLLAFAEVFGREGSLGVRLDAEDVLVEHALKRPMFGWGGWGRNRTDEFGQDLAITDGLWVIVIGQNGVFGLVSFMAIFVCPALLLLTRLKARDVWHPLTAPAAAMMVMLVMFMIDMQFNAMVNPIYMLATGGIATLCTRPRAAAAHARVGAGASPTAASIS